MERYQQLFTRLESSKEGAFVPFVTLGDPNPALSLQIIDTLIEAGADALELGIPFSDPLADGPTIQSATLRAFAAGVTPTQCFEMLAAIRQKHPTIPIGLLMYANPVFHKGIDAFYQRCAEVGVDSVLVADVPFEESAPFRAAAARHGIAPIFICPPNADDDLLREIASHGRGYTYLLSRAGVTGTESRAQLPLHHGEQAARVSRRAAAAGFRHLRTRAGKGRAAGRGRRRDLRLGNRQNHRTAPCQPGGDADQAGGLRQQYEARHPGVSLSSERPPALALTACFPSKFVPFIYSKI